MRTIEEWLSFSNSVRPRDVMPNSTIPCSLSYLYGDGTCDLSLQMFNDKIKEYWYKEYDREEIYDLVNYYFLYKAKPVEYIYYKQFLENCVKKGLRQKAQSQIPKIPDLLKFDYGMITFTSDANEITTDDKAIEYFDSIVKKYLNPNSKFRIKNPGKMNIWLEKSHYYHMHVFYQRDKGLWYTVNKGTLQKNNTIKWFMNNQCYEPTDKVYHGDYNEYLKHINRCLLYNYSDKTSVVIKPYFREIELIE